MSEVQMFKIRVESINEKSYKCFTEGYDEPFFLPRSSNKKTGKPWIYGAVMEGECEVGIPDFIVEKHKQLGGTGADSNFKRKTLQPEVFDTLRAIWSDLNNSGMEESRDKLTKVVEVLKRL